MSETGKGSRFLRLTKGIKANLLIILLLIFLFPMLSIAGTVSLPKTGQTTCYDNDGIETGCEGTGQDGEIRAGVDWPDPRFTDNGDETITDNLTGLIWTKNAKLGDYQTTAETLTWQEALDYIAGMNAGTNPNYGYVDWRLPNIRELLSLGNKGASSLRDWLKEQGFENVKWTSYWSSTTVRDEFDTNAEIYAWTFNVLSNFSYSYFTKSGSYAKFWPVRGGQENQADSNYPANVWKTGQTSCWDENGVEIGCTGTGQDGEHQWGVALPDPRFTNNGDGTFTDNLTSITWKVSNAEEDLTWEELLTDDLGSVSGIKANVSGDIMEVKNDDNHDEIEIVSVSTSNNSTEARRTNYTSTENRDSDCEEVVIPNQGQLRSLYPFSSSDRGVLEEAWSWFGLENNYNDDILPTSTSWFAADVYGYDTTKYYYGSSLLIRGGEGFEKIKTDLIPKGSSIFFVVDEEECKGTPDIEVSPTSIDFGIHLPNNGSEDLIAEVDIIIENAGDESLLVSITHESDFPGIFAFSDNISKCEIGTIFELLPKYDCTLTPQFIIPKKLYESPYSSHTNRAGNFTYDMSIHISSDDPDTPTVTVPVKAGTSILGMRLRTNDSRGNIDEIGFRGVDEWYNIMNIYPDPITASTDESLTLSLQVEALDYEGADADWWLTECNEDNGECTYYDTETGNWESIEDSTTIPTTYQGPLVSFPITEVLTISDLSQGRHWFYFAVDVTGMDGLLTEEVFYNYEVVDVE